MNDYPDTPLPGEGILIHDMPDADRPREKALRDGISTLSDAELMAIIFSTGIRGKSVLQLSSEIIGECEGHLAHLAEMSVAEICRRFKGIGKAKALTLLAGLELGRRTERDAAKLYAQEKPLSSPDIVWKLMKDVLEGLKHEEFWVLYLNQAGKLIKREQMARGGVAATVVDVRLILREAIISLASSIVLVHNHPSGNLRPSAQDISITNKITEAARVHDIRVNDHIIFTDKGFYSFYSEGKLNN